MKRQYLDQRFHAATLRLIAHMNGIVESYQAQGFVLSVRQLYYQLVAQALIPNTEQSYKRIAATVNDARLAGLMDWDAIEDRNRDIETRSAWDSGRSILESAASSFHMDMWATQQNRPFIVVEKAALAGILGGVARTFDVPLLAARGYPSVSIVREFSLDYVGRAMMAGQTPVILHLGDHDPSGIDMTRDLIDRVELFCTAEFDEVVEVRRLALNMPQIEKLKPPPNPAKVTDSRFEGYLKKFGRESWELDALEPSYLSNLVEHEIRDLIDPDVWDERKAEIELIRKKLVMTARRFKA